MQVLAPWVPLRWHFLISQHFSAYGLVDIAGQAYELDPPGWGSGSGSGWAFGEAFRFLTASASVFGLILI